MFGHNIVCQSPPPISNAQDPGNIYSKWLIPVLAVLLSISVIFNFLIFSPGGISPVGKFQAVAGPSDFDATYFSCTPKSSSCLAYAAIKNNGN